MPDNEQISNKWTTPKLRGAGYLKGNLYIYCFLVLCHHCHLHPKIHKLLLYRRIFSQQGATFIKRYYFSNWRLLTCQV